MRRYLPFLIIITVAIVAVGASTTLYRVQRRSYVNQNSPPAAPGTLAPNPAHIRGAPDAPVTLEEFGDFQCPACATTAGVLHAIEQEYGPLLRVVFWDFPWPNHLHGRDAALAAEAASEQGHFWEMHDLLYQSQEAWSSAPDIRSLFDIDAASLGLDVERFRKDFASEKVGARVDAEHAFGESRGVQNTPTLFINGRVLPPPYTLERLRAAIGAALAETKNR